MSNKYKTCGINFYVVAGKAHDNHKLIFKINIKENQLIFLKQIWENAHVILKASSSKGKTHDYRLVYN